MLQFSECGQQIRYRAPPEPSALSPQREGGGTLEEIVKATSWQITRTVFCASGAARTLNLRRSAVAISAADGKLDAAGSMKAVAIPVPQLVPTASW